MYKRILNIIKRSIKASKMYFNHVNEFGINATFWMCFRYVIPSYRKNIYFNAMVSFFEKELHNVIERYKVYDKEENTNVFSNVKKNLWICWLDGLEKMPEITKMCFENVKRKVPSNINVVLITYENYQEYINIPDIIIEKHKNKQICSAHFADIIRFKLLSLYGGMWLDANIYVSENLPEYCFNVDYFTQKCVDKNRYWFEPSRAQWCGGIWSGRPGNILFSFLADSLVSYWEKHNIAIDYIFFDYIILAAYKNLERVNKMIEEQQPNNEEIWKLWECINDKFDILKYKEICSTNFLHILNYKIELNKYDEHGNETFYGYLYKKVMKQI